jgi:hypothetical protein
MVGFTESQKVSHLNKVFMDSYKSPLSVVVVDSIERLLGEALILLMNVRSTTKLTEASHQTGSPLALGSQTVSFRRSSSSFPSVRQRFVAFHLLSVLLLQPQLTHA